MVYIDGHGINSCYLSSDANTQQLVKQVGHRLMLASFDSQENSISELESTVSSPSYSGYSLQMCNIHHHRKKSSSFVARITCLRTRHCNPTRPEISNA